MVTDRMYSLFENKFQSLEKIKSKKSWQTEKLKNYMQSEELSGDQRMISEQKKHSICRLMKYL